MLAINLIIFSIRYYIYSINISKIFWQKTLIALLNGAHQTCEKPKKQASNIQNNLNHLEYLALLWDFSFQLMSQSKDDHEKWLKGTAFI